MSDENMNLHIDSDWKAKAQQEKQRLREQEETRKKQQQASEAAKQTADSQAPTGQTGGASAEPGAAAAMRDPQTGEMPEASIGSLTNLLASQVLMALGGVPDPSSGQRVVNMPYARMTIDLLGVLEEKTKGNLTQEEADTLRMTVYQLRSRYISVSASMREK